MEKHINNPYIITNNDLLIRVEELLIDYFNSDKAEETGLPTVTYISEKLNISPNYLSDMLRTLTGQSTQQHIHNQLIRLNINESIDFCIINLSLN